MPIKKLLLATVLGGIAVFAWGGISHMVLPFYDNTLLAFSNEDAVVQAVVENAGTSGVYFLPYMPQNVEGITEEERAAAMAAAEEKMRRGPFMLASIRVGEMGSFLGNFVTQLVTDMLTVLLICLALVNATQLTFWGRVWSIVLIGLAGFASISLPMWNWYAFSSGFTLAELFDIVVGFFIAGLVIAKIKPVRVTAA